MRNSMKCPKCQGRQFYEVGKCTVPSHDSINGAEPLSVAAAFLPTGKTGFLGSQDHARFVGQLLAWVCASCGYTEFYVGQVAVLAYMAQQNAATVRAVDGHAASGGFR